jgi:diguanylate cyclase (GGDEF)-like protein
MAVALGHQASHDALTGLVNRVAFERRLVRVLETARMEGARHALCYLDLDQFKIINDTCGHMAGDELLRQLGVLLPGRVRKRDTLARLGGDEFGVLMERCSLGQAMRVAEGLREAVEGYRFVWEGKSFSLGVSIGLVPITHHTRSITEVLRDADSACYTAKDRGRNRIHVYRIGDEALVRRHGEMQWAVRINRALEEGRFELSYQPIVRLDGGQGGGHYELLLRMQDEQGRVVLPGVFLAAAERYQLSSKVDRWVIGKVCEWFAGHPRQLERLRLCGINLSGHSLGDEQFLGLVIRLLEDAAIPLEKLCFEVTETAAIANLANATRFITALRARGCRFALDDFGSGVSSFAYLRSLPVDYLKIDGTFVRHIVDDPIDSAMAQSINEIGHTMGKRTVAESVENAAILNKLQQMGVDYAQGFVIARPQPLEQLVADSASIAG